MQPTPSVVNILIVDIETSGLDPLYDCVLEFAAIPAQLTPEGLLIRYEESFTHIIKPYRLGFERMAPNVQKMHAVNGLLKEVATAAHTHLEVEDLLIRKVEEWFGGAAMNIQLCGNSIHFDRSFIKSDFKKLERRLSYRLLDMTPFRTLRNMISGESETVVKHRALDDCTYSAGLLLDFHQLIVNHNRDKGLVESLSNMATGFGISLDGYDAIKTSSLITT